MSGIDYRAQINMLVEPTDDRHVARRKDIKDVFETEPTDEQISSIQEGGLVYVRRQLAAATSTGGIRTKKVGSWDEFLVQYPVGNEGDVFGLFIGERFILAGWDSANSRWVAVDYCEAFDGSLAALKAEIKREVLNELRDELLVVQLL